MFPIELCWKSQVLVFVEETHSAQEVESWLTSSEKCGLLAGFFSQQVAIMWYLHAKYRTLWCMQYSDGNANATVADPGFFQGGGWEYVRGGCMDSRVIVIIMYSRLLGMLVGCGWSQWPLSWIHHCIICHLHFICADSIGWLVHPIACLQFWCKGHRVDIRVRGLATTKHLPTRYTIGPLHEEGQENSRG